MTIGLMNLSDSVLGKKTKYIDVYNPKLLFPIPRIDQRYALGLTKDNIPFFGIDIWNAYEISWLDEKGKPCVAIGEFYIPADSLYIIESKSFKLYLNSFNNTKFNSTQEVLQLLIQDLSKVTEAQVIARLLSLDTQCKFGVLSGKNIDNLDVECTDYDSTDSSLIKYDDIYVEEEVNSNLLKSNCLVTGQPDWGSISIRYRGKKIQHDSLLKYLVSFRNHNEFHEQCVERIFVDIKQVIKPDYLSVYARYTRRGGLDISPYRSTEPNFKVPSNKRTIRQ